MDLPFSKPEVIFHAKPALRRAYIFAFLYAGVVLYGRLATDLDPRFNRIWWGFFALFIVILAWVHLRRFCTDYLITTEEVQTKRGILARKIVAVPYARITNANVQQSLFERLLGIGSLRVDSAGGMANEIDFKRITTREIERAAGILRELRSKVAYQGVSQGPPQQLNRHSAEAGND